MRFVRPLREIRLHDLAVVGEKNAYLGEVQSALTPFGVNVPDGFALTGDAYRAHLRAASLEPEIRRALRGAHVGDVHDLVDRSDRIRDLLLRAPLPVEVARELDAAYQTLSRAQGELACDVAVRSSATCTDLPDASFAGQYETFLNVRGASALQESALHAFASLFTPRALADRLERGIDHLAVEMAVGVQRMVRSDLASAGVVYTAEPETGDPASVLVTSAWGLGESVAQERVVPDRLSVERAALEGGYRPLVAKKLGTKETKVVYDSHGHRQVITVPVPQADRERFSVSYEDAVELARLAVAIERHFAELRREATAMDVEWAKDGISGALYVLQARPEAASARRMARGLRLQEILASSAGLGGEQRDRSAGPML